MGQEFVVAESRTRLGDDLVDAFMGELDKMRAMCCGFPDDDPDDVLMKISGLVGRLAEMRVQLLRVNTPRAQGLRTKEVDPLRDDLELQFKIHSRRIAMMEWELKLAGGGA